ncbi:P-loop containing nucleoside triphosphate hydrolase protein [Xylona heveae TC161]|uniref:p-loop containing nucleoside triphosphate hydrolase protein n=1 Tax=Xylona heveae (strain CBS 132557 / TC161) TaxID=1328760 RepID=A0A165HCJ2_XYLHT|nr:P-loop containing nucleoside triphosphate hydrolase protein [Xylona heveae TC161]KZF23299.1 P-loop containing nucleoside triphosphate hydrolase protein [Xylona heveae TC161]
MPDAFNWLCAQFNPLKAFFGASSSYHKPVGMSLQHAENPMRPCESPQMGVANTIHGLPSPPPTQPDFKTVSSEELEFRGETAESGNNTQTPGDRAEVLSEDADAVESMQMVQYIPAQPCSAVAAEHDDNHGERDALELRDMAESKTADSHLNAEPSYLESLKHDKSCSSTSEQKISVEENSRHSSPGYIPDGVQSSIVPFTTDQGIQNKKRLTKCDIEKYRNAQETIAAKSRCPDAAAESLESNERNLPGEAVTVDTLFVPESPLDRRLTESNNEPSNKIDLSLSKHLLSDDESDFGDTNHKTKAKRPRKSANEDSEIDLTNKASELPSEVKSGESEKRKSRSSKKQKAGKQKGKKASDRKKRSKKIAKHAPKKKPVDKRWNSKSSEFLSTGHQLFESIFDQDVGGENWNSETKVSTRKNDYVKSLLDSVPEEKRTKIRRDGNLILHATKQLSPYNVRSTGDGLWNVSGMKTALLNYQVLGADWMRDREENEQDPRGGINADMMGLGKTIQTLAVMICNPPGKSDPKATLIVANKNLLFQWEREIKHHTEWEKWFPRILMYSSKLSVTKTDLEGFDIILTTYNEIMKSFPVPDISEETKNIDQAVQEWRKEKEERSGTLHDVQYYRIGDLDFKLKKINLELTIEAVLDEAQAIKNHKSQTSRACRALKAKYRWALSGTPVDNDLTEFYSYFKYLRISGIGNFRDFKKNFCNSESETCISRMQLLLSGIMLRRVHTNQLLNKPILQLPEKAQHTIMLKFDPIEQAIYDYVEAKYTTRIHYFIHSGVAKKEKKKIMAMLLRLRQMTAHVLIAHESIQHLFTLDDLAGIESTIASRCTLTPPQREILSQAKVMVQDHLKRVKEGDEDKDFTKMNGGNGVFSNPATPEGNEAEFLEYIQKLNKDSNTIELESRKICPECQCPPEKPYLSPCWHLFCAACLQSLEEKAKKKDLKQINCPACRTSFSQATKFRSLGVLKSETWGQQEDNAIARERKIVDTRWIDQSLRKLMSTKIKAVVSQTAEWIGKDDNCKIIIYTMFLPTIRILGRICYLRGWGHLKFHGEMSAKARDQTIMNFQNDPTKRILLATMQCGGVGLNLTMATRLICVDLWWNNSPEQQAFARIWRKGQTEKTQGVRFVVRGTIDEKLMELQIRKAAIIQKGIGERDKLDSLTIEDIEELFSQKGKDNKSPGFIPPTSKDEADEGGIIGSSMPEEDDI